MEESADLTPTAGVCTLPADFLEFRRIYLNTDQPVELEYLPPEQFYLKYPRMTNWTIGPSRYFTIESDELILSDVTTSNTVKVLYYKKLPALSANATNWLLTAHPDVYLYGALAEAADKTKNAADFQKYNAKTQAVVDQLTQSDKRGKFSGSAMRVISA